MSLKVFWCVNLWINTSNNLFTNPIGETNLIFLYSSLYIIHVRLGFGFRIGRLGDVMDWMEMEKRWQDEWDKHKIGRADVDEGKPKFYMVFAYPYPTGFLHTGHMRGYSYADAICRFKRLAGYNVLLPVGIHATGNGAIAKSQLIEKGDEKYINYLREHGIPDEEIQKMKDPEYYIKYFGQLYLKDFKRFGLIFDERTYITTIDEIYKRFITWQFHKLMDLGLLVQKEYYATFCENCGPVSVDPSESDLSKGGTAEKVEYTLLKFKTEWNGNDAYIIAATLRPETVFGQTNLWVDPNQMYAVIRVGDEVWIGSKPFAEKLKHQKDDVEVIGEVSGRDLIGRYVLAPGINREIIILPSKFCDPNMGSGIVTSVPSDAPHDWMGLYDLQRSKDECEKYGLDWDVIRQIKPIPIIETPGWGEFPAIEICEKLGIRDSTDPKLEDAKKQIYKSGYYTGKMRETAGKYAGLPVEKAKELIRDELIKQGLADVFYDLSEEVICRCGGRVFIKKVDHQWFIDYGQDWLNERSIEHAKTMNVRPEDYYNNLPKALEWFRERPCARMGRWLGTPFPFDKRYIIEAISDSTLYPIFYLVSKHKDKISPDNLTLEFFDYVFLGKGDVEEVSKKTGLSTDVLETIKREVWYWYPLDINLGGKEHQTVHFPPFVKNHVAILPKELWPRGIFVNYWIVSNTKEKMSKSKGGAQPVPGMAQRYGVDPMRLFYANAAKPYVDLMFDEQLVFEYRNRLEYLYREIERLWKLCDEITPKEDKYLDDWLTNRIKGYLYQISQDIDTFELKHASDIIYYNLLSDIQWYLRRKGSNPDVLRYGLRVMVQLMSVFTPHIAEEIWHEILGEDGFVSLSRLPTIEEVELKQKDSEWYLKSVVEDVNKILRVIKMDHPNKITIIVSDPWKLRLIEKAKQIDQKQVIPTLMKDPEFEEKKKVLAQILKRLIKLLPEYRDVEFLEEYDILSSAREYLQERFGAEIVILHENETDDPKAITALPLRPAIKVT